jgi:predicted negative regulator of RcsB-dependent stress response
MAAQSLASRSRRPPQAPDSEDIVLARALEFSQWAQRNARILIIVAVLAAAVVGGLIYYRSYQADRDARAAADFMVLEQTAGAADPTTAVADLQRFVTRYDGTGYADEARMAVGRLHIQQGQPQEAIPVLQEASRRMGRSPIAGQAGLLLGAAQEQAGDAPAAMDTYLRVGRDARFEFEQVQGLQAAAALREVAGDHAGAVELYRQLAGMVEEGTLERSIYEMRIAELEQQAAVR